MCSNFVHEIDEELLVELELLDNVKFELEIGVFVDDEAVSSEISSFFLFFLNKIGDGLMISCGFESNTSSEGTIFDFLDFFLSFPSSFLRLGDIFLFCFV